MNNLYKICFTKEKTDWEKYKDFFALFLEASQNFYFENKERFKTQEDCEKYLNYIIDPTYIVTRFSPKEAGKKGLIAFVDKERNYHICDNSIDFQDQNRLLKVNLLNNHNMMNNDFYYDYNYIEPVNVRADNIVTCISKFVTFFAIKNYKLKLSNKQYSENVINNDILSSYVSLIEEFKREIETYMLNKKHLYNPKGLKRETEELKLARPGQIIRYEDVIIQCAIKKGLISNEWLNYNNIENSIKHYDNNTDVNQIYDKNFVDKFLKDLNYTTNKMYNIDLKFHFDKIDSHCTYSIPGTDLPMFNSHYMTMEDFSIAGIILKLRSFIEHNKLQKVLDMNLLPKDKTLSGEDKDVISEMRKILFDFNGHGKLGEMQIYFLDEYLDAKFKIFTCLLHVLPKTFKTLKTNHEAVQLNALIDELYSYKNVIEKTDELTKFEDAYNQFKIKMNEHYRYAKIDPSINIQRCKSLTENKNVMKNIFIKQVNSNDYKNSLKIFKQIIR